MTINDVKFENIGNIAEYIKDFESSIHETVIAVIVGYEHEWSREFPDGFMLLNENNTNKVISRDEAMRVLDVNYDAGYGGADCPPVYAYTDNWVMVIGEYDGSTSWACIPRNPIECFPSFM